MIPQQSGIKLIGEAITISYSVEPSIGHGQFRLENPQAIPVNATVISVWLEVGEEHQPVSQSSVFDIDHDQALDPEHFEVAGTLRFLVGFPAVAYQPRPNQSVAVGLSLNVNGTELTARAPINFVRRLPAGH